MKMGNRKARVVAVGFTLALCVAAAGVAVASAQGDSGIDAMAIYVQPESAPVGLAAVEGAGLKRISDPVIKNCDFVADIADAEGGAVCMDDAIAKGMPEVQAYELAGRITGHHFDVDDLAEFVAEGGVDGES